MKLVFVFSVSGESLRHSDFANLILPISCHALWDIYGGFGHNGKIIQRTLPSHTQPSRSDLAAWASKLAAWASFRNFTHLRRETCV